MLATLFYALTILYLSPFQIITPFPGFRWLIIVCFDSSFAVSGFDRISRIRLLIILFISAFRLLPHTRTMPYRLVSR